MSTVAMPRLSDSMEEGTILRWLVADGEAVQRGQELAEIETDKASMVYEADAEGTLRILAREGETLPVGAPIAELVGADAAASSLVAEERAPAEQTPLPEGGATPEIRATPGGGSAPEGAASQVRAALGGGSAPEGAASDASPGARVKASPLARRLASEASIDIAALAGSGPGGRIVKADVEQAIAGSAGGNGAHAALAAGADDGGKASSSPRTGARSAPAGASAGTEALDAPLAAKGAAQIVELTRTQELIARRMAEAKATIPEFTLSCEIEMKAAVALRGELKRLAERRGVAAPSYNDLVVKACGLALREHPKANGSYRDGRFELHSRVNVAVAVAAEGALVVPVIRDADALPVWEIAAETRRLAAAVRDGTVTPPELSGGTFSVSNLGMFGVDSFTAVINPPQAAILAVGSLAERAVVRGGELVAAHTMHVTLSCDHRILYGADAARFLASIRELLQQPLALLA